MFYSYIKLLECATILSRKSLHTQFMKQPTTNIITTTPVDGITVVVEGRG